MTTSNEHNNAPAVPAVIECPISIGGSGSELAIVTPDGDATIHWTAVEQAAKEGNHFLSAMAKLMIAARDVGRAPAPAVPQGWRDFLTELSKQKPEKPDYWSSCGQCERNSSTAEDLLAATPDPVPAQGEPFGHFRVEPFGWTDCAKDDEGAIALYERPQEVGLTDEGRQQVFIAAERRMVREPNLSWRDAIVDEVIAALRAKGGK